MSTALRQKEEIAETHHDEQGVRDEVLRGLWRKGRACAADLANEFDVPMAAEDVLPVVKDLERDGLVRQIEAGSPTSDRYQIVYELVR